MATSSVFKVNGVNVLFINHVSPISFAGIAVKNGSNYEKSSQEGLSHFCEHMFFKGTEKRNYEQINKEFALIGASPNAYTSNTFVLYHLTLPSKNIYKAMDLLSDMFFNSTFEQSEIEKEKMVIQEEITMYEDDPQSFFFNYVGQTAYSRAIGHPVIGNKDVVRSVNTNKIKSYLKSTINKNNLMFVIVGNHTKKEVIDIVSNNLPEDHVYLQDGTVNEYKGRLWKEKLDFSTISFIENVNATQSIANIIYPYYHCADKNYYTGKVLENVIGGGMYSYLFNEIRAKKGLAYSTGAFKTEMEYGKLNTINFYAMLDTKNVFKFYEVVDEILVDISKNGIKKDLFDCAKMSIVSDIAKCSETSEDLSSHFKMAFLGETDCNKRLKMATMVKINDCNDLLKDMLSKAHLHIYMKSTKSI